MLLIFWIFSFVFAAPGESIILKNADSMIRDTSTNTVQLSGNVQIIYQQQYLSADKAIVYLNTQTLEAVGNVILTTPTVYSEADKIFLNYQSNTGVIYNGYVQSGSVSFEGELIYKTGENEYEAVNSTYSACTTCPPMWSIKGTEIRATFGGYARIKNSILRIANVPVFWLPYIMVPLKNGRQTGILTPSHSRSKKGGNSLSLPFYLVIDESQDATLTLTSSEFRGLKTNLEYRYVLAPGSSGILNYGYLEDQTFSESSRIVNTYGPGYKTRDRWFLTYKHLYELPNYYEHRADLNFASDLQYSLDFSDEFAFYREPSIRNRMSLTKYNENQHVSIDAILHQNQLKTDPLAENEDAVHKIPEIRWSVRTQRLGDSNFFYNLETDYVNYSRSYYAYDDMDSDGIYDEGLDKIRTGQRLILRPQLVYPISLGPYLNLLPSVSYQENIYKFTDVTDSPYSRYLQTKLSIRSSTFRVFDSGDPNEAAYKHKMTPFVTLIKTPFIQRSDDAFMGPKDLVPYSSDQSIGDTDPLQFDFKDRLAQRDVIELGIKHSLSKRTYHEGVPSIKNIANWSLSQTFDVRESESKESNSEPWSNITSVLELYFDKFEAYSKLDFYPYQNHVNSSSRLRFFPTARDYIELAYNQAFVIRKGEREVDDSAETKDILLSSVLRFNNVNFAGTTEYSAVTHNFEKYTAGLQIKPYGDCWSFSISQSYTSQDTVTGIKFEFLFDGQNDDTFDPATMF
jgi:LPS-assembly protein